MFGWDDLALGGLSALGGLFGNKGKSTQTTKPTLDPAYGGLQAQILKLMQQRLSSGGPGMDGYQANGLAGINKTFDLVGQHSANDLTARGLGTSPVAGVVEGNNQVARGGAINEFNNSIPLLKNQLTLQDLIAGSGLLQQGRGSTSTGTQTQGGGAAGAFGDLGSMLGFLYGSGQFGGGGKKPYQFPEYTP